MQLDLVADATVLEVVVQHEGDFQRCHRALVRHAHRDDDAPALKRLQRAKHLDRGFLGVERLPVLGQAGDQFGHRARSGGDHQNIVVEGFAALALDLVLVEQEFLRRIDEERDAGLEQRSLVLVQLVRRDATEGEVEQARLVHVLFRCRQHRDLGLA